MAVTKKTKSEIALLKKSGKILHDALCLAVRNIKSGVATIEIDRQVQIFITARGGIPAFKGYEPSGAAAPYPATMCISINDEVVHGIPSEYVIQEGDIVTLDCGVIYEDMYTDSAITIAVGAIPKEVKKLLVVTERALRLGIKEARVGKFTGDIGHAIGSFIEDQGFYVIKNLTGHGVGYAVHEDPVIYNYGKRGSGVRLDEGMVLAIEPMASISSEYTLQVKDDSYITHDGSFAAHFEHTIVVTKGAPLIVT